jgi:hypothetical protein
MIPPRIEFPHVRSYRQFYDVRSSREVIRFRVLERRGFTLLDGDWFSTPWELAPAARDAIFAYCEGRVSEWGGGKACVIIRTKSHAADELKRFLAEILANPSSWLRWNRDHQEFLPLPSLEVAA